MIRYKYYLLVLLCTLVIFLPTSCVDQELGGQSSRERDLNLHTAWTFVFRFRYVTDNPDHDYSEIFLVHNEEEAENFPEGVLVAWPVHTMWLQGLLDGINDDIRREVRDIPAFEELRGVTIPITVSDLVDNAENVIWIVNRMPNFSRISYEALYRANPYVHAETELISTTRVQLSDNHLQMITKFNYAVSMRFDFHLALDDTSIYSAEIIRTLINPWSSARNPSISQMELVHSREEAMRLPNNVIAAWPKESDFPAALADGLNRRHDISSWFYLEKHGLNYPLTPINFVDQWEKVNELWSSRSSTFQESLIANLSRQLPYVSSSD